MYSVPFLVWRSESWKRNSRIDVSHDMTHRMYSLSDFFHTWMDMAGIRFSGFDPGKSIINPLYTHGPVLIGNPAKPEALVDVRQKFFPAAAAPATPTITMQGPGPGPEVLRSSTPGYRPDYGTVTGTVPVRDRLMLRP
jgi:hypothetical protein